MPHILDDMNEKLDALKGNATSGAVYNLQMAVNKTDSEMEGHPNEEAMHDLMEDTQAFLCDGGTLTCGVTEKVENLVAEFVALYE